MKQFCFLSFHFTVRLLNADCNFLCFVGGVAVSLLFFNFKGVIRDLNEGFKVVNKHY